MIEEKGRGEKGRETSSFVTDFFRRMRNKDEKEVKKEEKIKKRKRERCTEFDRFD